MADDTTLDADQIEAIHALWNTPVDDLRPGITAAITCHPARIRNGLLARAIASVLAQTLQPAEILIVNDLERGGAGITRQHAVQRCGTQWIAWLDSDDEWTDPEHLAKLWRVAEETDSVYVFAWFHGEHPLTATHFGLPFDPARPHHTTMCVLERTDLAREVGFSPAGRTKGCSNEDWLHIKGFADLAVARGLRMTHLAERTWTYHMDGHNTSGLPGQGDAA